MYNIYHVHSPTSPFGSLCLILGHEGYAHHRGRVPSKLALGWVGIPDRGHGCPCLFTGFKTAGVQLREQGPPSPVSWSLPAKG